MVHLSVSIFCFRNSLVGGWRCKMGMILYNSLIHCLYSQSPFQSLLIKQSLCQHWAQLQNCRPGDKAGEKRWRQLTRLREGAGKFCIVPHIPPQARKRNSGTMAWRDSGALLCADLLLLNGLQNTTSAPRLSFPAELWHWPQVLSRLQGNAPLAHEGLLSYFRDHPLILFQDPFENQFQLQKQEQYQFALPETESFLEGKPWGYYSFCNSDVYRRVCRKMAFLEMIYLKTITLVAKTEYFPLCLQW